MPCSAAVARYERRWQKRSEPVRVTVFLLKIPAPLNPTFVAEAEPVTIFV
jgi:hypothetical protein